LAKRRPRNSTTSDIQAIRKSLVSIVETLIGALERVGTTSPTAAARTSPPPATLPRRRAPLSAERKAALQLQGRYMALVRTLKPRQKARVKTLRAAKGVRAAINLATRLANR
jgi:hypothetical protein